MKATPVLRIKEARHGGVIEMVIWRLPEPVPPCAHRYKYRMVFVKGGRRIIGFDPPIRDFNLRSHRLYQRPGQGTATRKR